MAALYLLDTNILIAALKGQTAVKQRLETLPLDSIRLSTVVLGELEFGAEKKRILRAQPRATGKYGAAITTGWYRCRHQSPIRTGAGAFGATGNPNWGPRYMDRGPGFGNQSCVGNRQ